MLYYPRATCCMPSEPESNGDWWRSDQRPRHHHCSATRCKSIDLGLAQTRTGNLTWTLQEEYERAEQFPWHHLFTSHIQYLWKFGINQHANIHHNHLQMKLEKSSECEELGITFFLIVMLLLSGFTDLHGLKGLSCKQTLDMSISYEGSQ